MPTYKARLQLYTLGVQELRFLLAACDDKAVRKTFSTICHVTRTSINTLIPLDIPHIMELAQPDRDFAFLVKTCDILVEHYPDSAWPYILRARALWGIEYYACALEDLEKANVLLPHALIPTRMYAETLYFMGRTEEALHVINTDVMTIRDDDSRTYFLRYMIYSTLALKYSDKKQYYKDKSLADLETTLELNPAKATKIMGLIARIKFST